MTTFDGMGEIIHAVYRKQAVCNRKAAREASPASDCLQCVINSQATAAGVIILAASDVRFH